MKNVRELIEASFEDLVCECGLPQVTVSDICKRAGVSRKTFYTHYVDKFDVLERVFRRDIYDAFEHNIRFAWRHGIDTNITLLDLYEKLYEKKDFYLNAMTYEGQNSLQKFFEKNTALLSAGLMKDLGTDSLELEYAACYYSSAHVGLLRKWIAEDMSVPPEELVRYYQNAQALLSPRDA